VAGWLIFFLLFSFDMRLYTQMRYYRGREEARTGVPGLGCVPLAGCVARPREAGAASFELATPSGRVYAFRTRSDHERESWLDAIRPYCTSPRNARIDDSGDSGDNDVDHGEDASGNAGGQLCLSTSPPTVGALVPQRHLQQRDDEGEEATSSSSRKRKATRRMNTMRGDGDKTHPALASASDECAEKDGRKRLAIDVRYKREGQLSKLGNNMRSDWRMVRVLSQSPTPNGQVHGLTESLSDRCSDGSCSTPNTARWITTHTKMTTSQRSLSIPLLPVVASLKAHRVLIGAPGLHRIAHGGRFDGAEPEALLLHSHFQSILLCHRRQRFTSLPSPLPSPLFLSSRHSRNTSSIFCSRLSSHPEADMKGWMDAIQAAHSALLTHYQQARSFSPFVHTPGFLLAALTKQALGPDSGYVFWAGGGGP
jgi:hypothetical protein